MIRNRIYRLEKVNKLKLQDKIVTILTAIIIILILGISGGTQFYDLLSRNQTDIPNDSPVPITTPVATAAPTPTPFCQTPSPSPSLTPQTTTNSIPTPEITTNPSSTSITTQTSVPLDLWWQTNWASNGAAFNVTYNKVPNPQPLVESLSSKSIRNDYGGLINNTETKERRFGDTYGKLSDIIIISNSFSSGSLPFLTPNPPAAWGSLVYPASSSFEQSKFSRNFTQTCNIQQLHTRNNALDWLL